MSLLSHVLSNISNHIHNNFPIIPKENLLYPDSPIHTYKKYGFWERKKVNVPEVEVEKYKSLALADEAYIKNYEYLFSLLSTDYSKAKLIDVLTFRYMGSKYVNCFSNYNEIMIKYKSHMNIKGYANIIFQNNEIDEQLGEYHIEKLFNIPITFITKKDDSYINVIFNFFPVSIPDPDMEFSIQEGDIVLDGGGFVGDTALLFAHYCKSTGHVYAFEFSPSSIQIFRQNLFLNPIYAKNITLIPQPLYNNSRQPYMFKKGNKLNEERQTHIIDVKLKDIQLYEEEIVSTFPEAHKSVKTRSISIDGFINQQKLDKVDYIKLVVSGSELSALKGAEQTLRKFKPKLLIALYHKPEDLTEIPKFIHDLNLGYKIGFTQTIPYLDLQYLYAMV